MTLYRALAGWALLLLAVPPWGIAAAQSGLPADDGTAAARAAVEQCIGRIGEEQLGLAVMEVRCPDLAPALQALGVSALLIESSRAKFDRDSLRQLPVLTHPARAPAPAVAPLGLILSSLRPTPLPTRSWWERLVDWLSERLGRNQQDNAYPWLGEVAKMLQRLEWLWKAIFWATVLALPIGVAVIVMREVRAMGGRSQDEPVALAGIAAGGPAESRLAHLRQLPMRQRPAQLFALLISRLVAAGRLPPNRSLTHREVARRAQLDDIDQRRLIESLARLSERQLYSGLVNLPDGVDELLARGEDLYTTGWGRAVEH